MVVFDIYEVGLRALWQYPEFQTVMQIFRYGVLVLAGVMVIIALLHVSYMLGFNSPLYRRRSPRAGWSKKILPVIALLFVVFIGFFWLSGRWIAQAA